MRALCLAAKEFKLKRGLVITEDDESTENADGFQIIFKPLWRWLVENQSSEGIFSGIREERPRI